MKTPLFFFLLLCSTVAVSQSKIKSKQNHFKISGTLVSADDQKPLESATVYLERIKDSSVVNYTISDKKGQFTLEDKSYDSSLNLFISYIGYQTYFQKIDLNKPEINLHVIQLKTQSDLLNEVVIKSRAPVTIKKDTIEFNVKSFKTNKDATIEDLLKKLPGLEVDAEGNVSVNGKEVDKILVNGKPFFGSDPTITTRNLSKEIIEKVQITDTKTKDEAFSGEEGEQKNKTINLVIKEENNKGVFGNISVGKGTNDLYEVAGMVNLFDNDRRLSFVGGGNNANSNRFSLGGISNMYGGMRVVSGSPNFNFGGGGITSSKNAGVNYADELSKNVDLSTDYFFNTTSTENENSIQRENILPDQRYFSNSSNTSLNENDNHSANMSLEIKLDSTILINIRPNFSTRSSYSESTTEQQTSNEQLELSNQSNSTSFSRSKGKNFSNNLSLTKKFKDGGFLKFKLYNSANNTDSDNFLDSETEIFGVNPTLNIRNQYTDDKRESTNLKTGVLYRLPIKANEIFVDMNYEFSNNKQENSKSTYDFDAVSQDFTQFNTDLSTDFNYENRFSSAGVNFAFKKEKLSTNVGANYVFKTLENSDYLRPNLNLKHDFKAVQFKSNVRYKISNKTSVSASYNLSNISPQLSQLQPFKNVTNPLNTIVGNPNLEPTSNHSIHISFFSSNYQEKSGFNGYLSTNFRQNQVVSKSTIDENFVRTTTYTNVDGNRSFNANGGYHKSIKLDSVKTMRLNFSIGTNSNRSVNFSNGVQYSSNNTSLTPRVSLTFNWKSVLEIQPNYSLSFSKSTYDLDQFKNQNFSRHSLGIRTSTYVPKNLEWRNTIDYSYNPQIADGFQKSSWNWNSTVSYTMFKNKGTLSLKVYDLLNQNTNARRIATQNYIQDSQSSVLSRYFMLSFNWKFNSMGAKKTSGRYRTNSLMMF